MISRTWQGYEIKKSVKGTRFPVYVKSIYKGKVTWTTDCTYAKHYTEATAKKLDKQIDEDIRAGKLANEDILPDGEDTIRNLNAVLDKLTKEQQKEYTTRGNTQYCQELWNMIEDVRADIELYTKAISNL